MIRRTGECAVVEIGQYLVNVWSRGYDVMSAFLTDGVYTESFKNYWIRIVTTNPGSGPDRDPYRHQNVIDSSLGHFHPFKNFIKEIV